MTLRYARTSLAVGLCFGLVALSAPFPARALEGAAPEAAARGSAEAFLPAWAGALASLAGQPGAPPSAISNVDLTAPEGLRALEPFASALQARGLTPEKLRSLSSLPASDQRRIGELLSQAAREVSWSAEAGVPALLSSADAEALDSYQKRYGPWLSPQTRSALEQRRGGLEAGRAAASVRETISAGAAVLERPEIAAEAPSPLIEQILRRDSCAIALKDFTATLLPDNEGSLRENLAVLGQAQTRAAVSTFIWSDDAAGRAIAYAALRAARRGVKVTAIVDAFFITRADRRMLSNLAREGVEVYVFRPLLKFPLQSLRRMHDKAVWADAPNGRVAFLLGGRNKADRYLKGDGVFDVDVKLTLDPAAAREVYRRQFEIFLRSKQAVRLVPAAEPMTLEEERGLAQAYAEAIFPSARSMTVPPPVEAHVAWGAYVANRGRRAGVTWAIEALIGLAKRQVILANAYFIPNAFQRTLLADKLKEGLFLGVFSNSRVSTSHSAVVRLMEGVVSGLLFAGMRIYQHLGGEVHAKTSSADGRYAVIGAANLDPRSEFLDTQNGVVLDSPEIARAFDAAVRARQGAGRFQSYRGNRLNVLDACIRLLLEPWTWLQ